MRAAVHVPNDTYQISDQHDDPRSLSMLRDDARRSNGKFVPYPDVPDVGNHQPIQPPDSPSASFIARPTRHRHRIGILSGGSIAPSNISDLASFKQNVKVVFVSYGSRENGASAKANVEALQQAGVKSIFYESPNTQHDWVTWRRSLIQFAPLVFQD
jgi:hypothetical protein